MPGGANFWSSCNLFDGRFLFGASAETIPRLRGTRFAAQCRKIAKNLSALSDVRTTWITQVPRHHAHLQTGHEAFLLGDSRAGRAHPSSTPHLHSASVTTSRSICRSDASRVGLPLSLVIDYH